jgi:hypothetical protein
MSGKNVYNGVAAAGRIMVSLQGVSCMALAIVALVVGSNLIGSSRGDRIFGRVKEVECLDDIGKCGVTVSYIMQGKKYQSTFTTSDTLGYAAGDTIGILVDPEMPHLAIEDLPWKQIGYSMIFGALCAVAAAYFAVQMVSERKNIAAFAGIFGFFTALFN